MPRRVALFILSAAAAVALAFVSQTGWVSEETARLLTVAAAFSGAVAVVVLGVLTVRDHVLDRLSGLARWFGGGLVHVGERIARITVLPAVHAVSRGVLPPMLWFSRPARRDGPASDLASQVSGPAVGLSLVITLAIGGQLLSLWIIPAALVAAGAVALVRSLAMRRIGGITGDVLGAAQQVVEVALLVPLAAAPTGSP